MNIDDVHKTLTDNSFLCRYYNIKWKNYLKRRYQFVTEFSFLLGHPVSCLCVKAKDEELRSHKTVPIKFELLFLFSLQWFELYCKLNNTVLTKSHQKMQGYNARRVIFRVVRFFVLQCTGFGRKSKHKTDSTAWHGIHLHKNNL